MVVRPEQEWWRWWRKRWDVFWKSTPKKVSDGQDEGHEKRGGEKDSKVILNLDNWKDGEGRGCVIFWLKMGNSLDSVR